MPSLNETKIGIKAVYFRPGDFVVEVVRCLLNKSRNGRDAYIVEFKVLQTSDALAHPVGTTANWYQDLTNADIAFPALKRFLLAALGYDDPKKLDGIDVDALYATTYKENSLAGRKLRLSTSLNKTRAGKDFTKHRFSPPPPVAT